MLKHTRKATHKQTCPRTHGGDPQPAKMPVYILEEDLRPASKEVLLSAASCRYLHGLKNPARPAGSYCFAQPFNLSATTLAPSKSAHLINPPLHTGAHTLSRLLLFYCFPPLFKAVQDCLLHPHCYSLLVVILLFFPMVRTPAELYMHTLLCRLPEVRL